MKCAALYLHDIGAGTSSSVFNGASADIDNISPTGPQRPCKGIVEDRQYLKNIDRHIQHVKHAEFLLRNSPK